MTRCTAAYVIAVCAVLIALGCLWTASRAARVPLVTDADRQLSMLKVAQDGSRVTLTRRVPPATLLCVELEFPKGVSCWTVASLRAWPRGAQVAR
jgi:hypothetical protein